MIKIIFILLSFTFALNGQEYKLLTLPNGGYVYFKIPKSELPSQYLTEFVSATGIVNEDTLNALEFLTSSFSDSITFNGEKYIYPISKMYGVYPTVGGSENTQAYNLVDTADYKLQFNGILIHDSVGFQSSSNGYVDFGFEPDSTHTGNLHFSFYSAIDTFDGSNINYVYGLQDTSGTGSLYFSLNAQFSDPPNAYYTRTGGSSNYMDAFGNKGNFLLSMTDTSSMIFRDGMKIMHSRVGHTTVTGQNIFMLARHRSNGNTDDYTDLKCSFATFGQHLSDEEAFHKAIIERQFQRLLNRETDSIIIERNVSEYPIEIIDSGKDWIPDSTKTNYDLWRSFSYGAIICLQQRSWYSSFAGFSHPIYFGEEGLDSLDMIEILDSLQEFGVEYVIFTEYESTGYSFDTLPDYPARLVEKYNPPTVYDSRNNPFINPNIVSAFFDGCRDRGIEPILYHAFIRNLPLTPKNNFLYQIFDSLDVVHYNNWYMKLLQNRVAKYNPKFLWLDLWQHGVPYIDGRGFYDSLSDGTSMSSVDFQGLYNSVKDIDSNCMIIANNWGDTAFTRYPFDIASNEEIVIGIVERDDSVVADTHMIYDGVTYNIPSEFICNVAGDEVEASGFWYALNDTGTIVRPYQQIEDFYERAISVGAKFCLSVIPGRNGTVQEGQWNIWRELQEHINP